jgi:hypothetical protein
MHPPTVSPTGATTQPKPHGRPRRPRFLGFDPFESPWHPDACLARRTLDAPLGFPFEGTRATAWTGISPDLLSRASPGSAPVRGGRLRRRPAPQSIDQPSLDPTRIPDRKRPEATGATLRGFSHPHRPEHSDPPKALAMCSPGSPSYVAADRRIPFGPRRESCRSCRDCLRCQAFAPG